MAGETVRVLLANRPRMLRELLRKLIDRQGDMQVVGEELDPLALLLAVGERHADVVVLSLSESEEDPGLLSHLLSEYPKLVVLALSPVRERACLYWLVVARRTLDSTGDEPLLAALRGATLHGGGLMIEEME